MAELTMTRRIQAPVGRVFDVFTDIERAPERIRGIKRIEVVEPGEGEGAADSSGGMRRGMRFRETRIVFGKEATEMMEVIELEPDRSYTLGCESCGARYRFGFTFRPDGDATLVDMRFEVTPVRLMAKLMAPLSGLMMKACRKAMEQDLEDLRAAAEAPVGAQP